MLRRDGADLVADVILPERGPVGVAAPGPGVAEPDGGQNVKSRGFRAAVLHRDLHENVFGRRLGILDEDVEIPIVVEHAGVEQLVLQLAATPRLVALDDLVIGKRALRILVEILHVRVRRRRVEVEVIFLHVLAVIAFAVGEPEQPFLDDRIGAVPQGQRDAQLLPVVGKSGETVLAPPIGA